MDKQMQACGNFPEPEPEPQAVLWPSERIAPGGLFHTHKMEYSKETADLLKLLMEEAKMSMMMRKRINYHLRNGEPLPKPQPPRSKTPETDKDTLAALHRSSVSKRKSFDEIVASGAYEMPIYRPRPNNRKAIEVDKKLLQEAMSGLPQLDVAVKPMRLAKEPPQVVEMSLEEQINELLAQIQERTDWLEEMEKLGAAKQYRHDIGFQISQRLRKIAALEKQLEAVGSATQRSRSRHSTLDK